jgi:hypothetical protein
MESEHALATEMAANHFLRVAALIEEGAAAAAGGVVAEAITRKSALKMAGDLAIAMARHFLPGEAAGVARSMRRVAGGAAAAISQEAQESATKMAAETGPPYSPKAMQLSRSLRAKSR